MARRERESSGASSWIGTLALGLAGALAACSGGGGGDAEDSEPEVAFSFQSGAGGASEGGAALAVGVVLHTTRAALGSSVTVDVVDRLTGSATEGTDYGAIGTQVVTFAADAADGDVQVVLLTALADGLVEGADETVALGLENPSLGQLVGPLAHTTTILDADHATLAFLASSSTTPDEQPASHAVTLGLELDPGDVLLVDATALVRDLGTGSATSGVDYAAFAQQAITFPAGSADGATTSVSLAVLDDALAEVDETVVLALGTPGAGTLLGATAAHQVGITDDDGLAESNFDASEGATGIENVLAYDELVDLGSQNVGGGPNAGTRLRVANTGGASMALGAPLLGGSHPDDFVVELELASAPPPPAGNPVERLGLAPDLPSPLVAVEALAGDPARDRPGQALALDLARLAELGGLERATLHGFAVPGIGDLTLALERAPLPLAGGAELRIDGVPQPGGLAGALGDLSLWSGFALELPGSHVYLALSSAGARGYLDLAVAGGLVHVFSEERQTAQSGPPLCRIVHEADLALLGADRPALLCEQALSVTGEPPLAPSLPEAAGEPGSDQLLAADCELALETDYQFYQLFGSTQGATDYVAGLIGAISDQYFTDVQTTLSVAYLGLYTDPGDPWTSQDGGGTASDLLAEFRSAWTTNGWPASANLAHFLSGASLGGGVAYVGVLCNSSFGFGVSGNLNGNIDWGTWSGNAGSFTWDFVVVAHELGHNFGASHTHSYCPPLDHCYSNCDGTTSCSQGTIMSYCHTCGGMDNIDLHFHQKIANIMRQSVQASCLGDSALAGGDYVQYRVRFSPLLSSGLRSATLSFEHDAPNQTQPFVVRLQGTGN